MFWRSVNCDILFGGTETSTSRQRRSDVFAQAIWMYSGGTLQVVLFHILMTISSYEGLHSAVCTLILHKRSRRTTKWESCVPNVKCTHELVVYSKLSWLHVFWNGWLVGVVSRRWALIRLTSLCVHGACFAATCSTRCCATVHVVSTHALLRTLISSHFEQKTSEFNHSVTLLHPKRFQKHALRMHFRRDPSKLVSAGHSF